MNELEPPRPSPSARERELLRDERTRSDVDARPGRAAASPAEPTRAFPIVLAPPGGPETYDGPAVGPADRRPCGEAAGSSPGGGERRSGTLDQRTQPFLAVLAAGDQATQVPGGPPTPQPERTLGFPGVLPVPGQRPAAAVVEPGHDLGGFRIVKRLEQRATCELFAATHARHGECVVQVLTDGMTQAPAGRAFLLEARARTTLEDPRLVRILGLGDAPRPWVALERLRGETLRQLLARQRSLGPARAGRLVLDLARGLSRLHARRIAHGDLTADDVRLEAGRAVITGFGTWKAIDGEVRRAYPGGPALGPAVDVAPELASGERASPATDVWALGLLLVEAATGQACAADPANATRGRRRGAPPRLPTELPRGLVTVATRCLELAPTDRYGSAQELAQALHLAAPEEERTSRRLLVAAVVLAIAALVAAVVFAATR